MEDIRKEFQEYVNSCVLTRRPKNKTDITIGGTAADSYMSFVEVDKLFSYNPSHWVHINSIFDITSSKKILEIFKELMTDEVFTKVDSEGSSQYFRSNALKQYYCFLRAREIFKPYSTTVGTSVVNFVPNPPLQQIFYGAPGTGKSHGINQTTKGKSVIRTTFHPDSDYSTFVGAYKPIMEECEARVVPVVFNNGFSMDQNTGTYREKRISYKFVKQAFLKAYLGAWKKYAAATDIVEPQYLIIEEINRGNCAQIFGDIFQLLDRADNNFSSYPIEADTDIQTEIQRAFAEEEEYKLSQNISADDAIENYTSNYGKTLSEDIQEGRVLLLPPNLYIWATMNTSDQSLFPIDSAFKRRWDWKYVPIDTKKEDWTIVADGKKYAWGSFLERINKEIYEATSSEDKKLGFYFCKAQDGVVSADKFVSKVLFYIYNDVFKDYGFNKDFFKDGNEVMTFQSFYNMDGTVNEAQVAKLLNNLGLKEITAVVDTEDSSDGDDKTGMTVTYNGQTIKEKNDLETYVKALTVIGLDKIEPLNITCYNQLIVGKTEPGNYAWRTVDDFKVLTFKLHRHMQRILNEIATGLNIALTVSHNQTN